MMLRHNLAHKTANNTTTQPQFGNICAAKRRSFAKNRAHRHCNLVHHRHNVRRRNAVGECVCANIWIPRKVAHAVNATVEMPLVTAARIVDDKPSTAVGTVLSFQEGEHAVAACRTYKLAPSFLFYFVTIVTGVPILTNSNIAKFLPPCLVVVVF